MDIKNKDIGILSSIGINVEFLNRVEQVCEKAEDVIKQNVFENKNLDIHFAQGKFAEVWHAETFNVDAVLNRMDNIVANAPNSYNLGSPDILVMKNGEVVDEYGSKYYKDAKSSVDAQKGYSDQSRLIPADQLEDANEYINRQTAKDYATGRENRIANAQELENIQDKMTSRVSYGKAESRYLERDASTAKTKEFRSDGEIHIQPQIDYAKIAEESLKSGAIAAGITISLTIAPRIFNMMVHRVRSGEFQPDVMRQIFQGTGNNVIKASLRGGIASSITMSAKAGILGEAARSIDPTLVGSITFIAFEGAKDFSRLAKGEITGEVFTDNIISKSVSATAGVYGAAIGQVIIPVPIVGAMAGAMLGSIIAQNGYQFLNKITDAYFRTAEFEQMKQINKLLAGEWNTFLNDYERWLQKNHQFEIGKEKLQTEIEREDGLNDNLNKKLLQVLKEVNNE